MSENENKESIFDKLFTFLTKKADEKIAEKKSEDLYAISSIIKKMAEEMMKVVVRINEMSEVINKHNSMITELAIVQELVIQKLKAENADTFSIESKVPKKEDMN